MKIYSSVPVTATFQRLGTQWLGILRGQTESIELVFNGLYNLMATNGKIEFRDHSKCLATFWTNRRNMRRFFFNQYFIPKTDYLVTGKTLRSAMRFALERLAEIQENSEPFLTFERPIETEDFGSGSITAERPDNDMKDEILSFAFSEKRVD